MKVRYFAKGDITYPSSRYRAHQFVEALRDQGIELRIETLFGSSWMRAGQPGGGALRRVGLGALYGARRLWGLVQRHAADLIVVEQELVPLMPCGLERLVLGSAIPVAIELDDAHHLVPMRAAKMAAWFASADGVIAGNEVLAQAVRQVGGHPVVVPTCIDLDQYPEHLNKPHESLEDGEPLRLIWVGLPANVAQLLDVRDALEPMLEAGTIDLSVVTSPSADLQGLKARLIPWSPQAEREALRRAHVGLMPLPQTAWAAGKCALKLLQYQAAGLACVASPVGVNTALEGRGGVLLAEGATAWQQALMTLRDGGERSRLGAQGRALVEEAYSVQAWAPKLALIYRKLAGHP